MLHVYCRVSTARQDGEDKTSLEQQQAVGMLFAQTQSMSKFDVQVYVDSGVSGSTRFRTRPAGEDLLIAVQEGDIVIASKMDRMFRSSIDALETVNILRDKKADLVLFDMGTQSVMRDGPSKLFFAMLAAFAEFERGRIVERIQLGIHHKRKRGGYTGGRNIPYGMKVVGKGPAAKLVEDPDQAPIFELIETQLEKKGQFFSANGVAKELTAKGVVNRQGNPYKSNHIARMAKIVKARHVEQGTSRTSDQGQLSAM